MAPIQINGITIDPDKVKSDFFPAKTAAMSFIILRAKSPLSASDSSELQKKGCVIQERLSDEVTYLCVYKPADMKPLLTLGFVQNAWVYHVDFKLDESLKSTALAESKSSSFIRRDDKFPNDPLCWVTASLHYDVSENGEDVLKALLKEAGSSATRVEKTDSGLATFTAWVPSTLLPTLVALDSVRRVYPYLEGTLWTVRARPLCHVPAEALVTANQQPTNWGSIARFLGQGQVVAVIDSGIDIGDIRSSTRANPQPDALHPAFRGRIANEGDVLNLEKRLDDTDGHGTHVAGIISGNYDEGLPDPGDCGKVAGTAPGAQLYIMCLTGGTTSLKEMFSRQLRIERFVPHIPVGIGIVNKSWGTEASGTQTGHDDQARYVDSYALEKTELLIVEAAGNDGEKLCKVSGLPGSPSLNRQIISSVAAFNSLTVGATSSNRLMREPEKAYKDPQPLNPQDPVFRESGRPWTDQDALCGDILEPGEQQIILPTDTLRLPAKEAGKKFCMSLRPKTVPVFSSKGPTQDGRLKPDLVAPGTAICSAWPRSLREMDKTTQKFKATKIINGTSQAAPYVSGILACARQAYMLKFNRAPKATTLKAMAVNGATSCKGGDWWFLRNTGTFIDQIRYYRVTLGDPPDCIQGHGQIDYERTLLHITGAPAPAMPPARNTHAGSFEHLGLAQKLMWPNAPDEVNSAYIFPRAGDNYVNITLSYNNPQGKTLQADLALGALFQIWDTTEDQTKPTLNEMLPPPNKPNMYTGLAAAAVFGPNHTAADLPQLANLKKIRAAFPGQPGPNQIVKIQIVVTSGPFGRPDDRVPFSVCWLTERVDPVAT